MDIFDASEKGNLNLLKQYLSNNPDLSLVNEYGFTALHCAAMGSNSMEKLTTVEVLRLLIEAGSPLEIKGGGRTPLYILAEFSPYVEPVQLLLDAGANPDVYDEHGNHIVENAMVEEVQELLSNLTGKATPVEAFTPESIKMKSGAWKKAKSDLDIAFQKLADSGLIALQDAGYTQSDGFEDCSEQYHARNNEPSIAGFCFYTRQDLDRAKDTSELPLAIWGAPEGGNEETIKVGNLVVQILTDSGFDIKWNGSSLIRPSVYLQKYSQ